MSINFYICKQYWLTGANLMTTHKTTHDTAEIKWVFVKACSYSHAYLWHIIIMSFYEIKTIKKALTCLGYVLIGSVNNQLK